MSKYKKFKKGMSELTQSQKLISKILLHSGVVLGLAIVSYNFIIQGKIGFILLFGCGFILQAINLYGMIGQYKKIKEWEKKTEGQTKEELEKKSEELLKI